MKNITNCLLWIGGYDPNMVRNVKGHFKIRYYCYGLAIMVTCLAAFFGAFHTGIVYFHNVYAALLLAILWTFCIAVIEHQIVVFMDNSNRRVVSVVRVLASLIFSVVISSPLVLALCEGPVQKEIAAATQTKVERLQSAFDQRNTTAQKLIEAREGAFLKSKADAALEVAGGGSTSKAGEGPISRRLDEISTIQQQQLAKEKATFENDLLEWRKALALDIEKARTDERSDELTQFKVLLQLVKTDGAIRFRFLTVWMALLFLELLPLVLKMTAKKSKGDEYQRITRGMEVENEIAVERFEHSLKSENQKLALERNTAMVAALMEVENSLSYINNPVLRRMAETQLELGSTPSKDAGLFTTALKRDGRAFAKGYEVLVATRITTPSPFVLTTALANHVLELCSEALTEQDCLALLFTFVTQQVTYDEQHDAFLWGYRNAMEAYVDKRAICGESTFLFIALARMVGLKADYVHVEVDCNGVPVSHACTLVLNHLVDIAYNTIDAQHVKFQVLNDQDVENRFRSWRILDPTSED